MNAARASALACSNEELAVRAQKGDARARDQIIRQNRKFVRSVVYPFLPQCNLLDIDDLIAEGEIGLNHAINEFDPSMGTKLITYAVWWIKATVRRAIYDTDDEMRTPSHMNEKLRSGEVKREWERLAAEGNSIDAIRLKLIEKYHWRSTTLAAAELKLRRTLRLDATVTNQHGMSEARTRLEVTPSDEPNAEELLESKRRVEYVRRELDGIRAMMCERDLAILDERIDSDDPVTLQELGERFGLSRERIRQCETKILRQLRETFAGRRVTRRAKPARAKVKEPEPVEKKVEEPVESCAPEEPMPPCAEPVKARMGNACGKASTRRLEDGRGMCAQHAAHYRRVRAAVRENVVQMSLWRQQRAGVASVEVVTMERAMAVGESPRPPPRPELMVAEMAEKPPNFVPKIPDRLSPEPDLRCIACGRLHGGVTAERDCMRQEIARLRARRGSSP